MNVDGYRGRGRTKKRWMDCVKTDIAAKSVTCEMTSDMNFLTRYLTYIIPPPLTFHCTAKASHPFFYYVRSFFHSLLCPTAGQRPPPSLSTILSWKYIHKRHASFPWG
ncbi:unnamed protein product [Chrysodeixis includens]|uniref:Uncharacterized protein n=1 Tax=Chrysodeixis includens TaxID=689277 RepID=A0A9N8L543_CHRIL|nr:unnamed protein product [Chrysodeixis includens]